MSDETTQGQPHGQQGRRGGREATDDDRAWSQRMMDEREKRDQARFETLKQIEELTQRGVAHNGVKIEDMSVKLDAMFEKTVADETLPTSTFGRTVYWLDQKIKKALPYVTVAGAAVAVGYGGYRGVKAVRNSMRKRVDVHADVTIKPVGEGVRLDGELR